MARKKKPILTINEQRTELFAIRAKMEAANLRARLYIAMAHNSPAAAVRDLYCNTAEGFIKLYEKCGDEQVRILKAEVKHGWRA